MSFPQLYCQQYIDYHALPLFYLFYKIEKGFVLPTQSTDNKTQSIDMERINKILELFSQKKEKSTKITNSPSPIVDPSI